MRPYIAQTRKHVILFVHVLTVMRDATRCQLARLSHLRSRQSAMVKRRTVIDSDNEQSDQEGSPSGVKRPRLDVVQVEDLPQRSLKSKSKGKGKAKDDNDILNDIRVDDDDDIAAVRDTHAEEDEGAQERFEEEHEESIRESIRQRNRHQGVGFGLTLPVLSILSLASIGCCKIRNY
jgi:hypothetical protein